MWIEFNYCIKKLKIRNSYKFLLKIWWYHPDKHAYKIVFIGLALFPHFLHFGFNLLAKLTHGNTFTVNFYRMCVDIICSTNFTHIDVNCHSDQRTTTSTLKKKLHNILIFSSKVRDNPKFLEIFLFFFKKVLLIYGVLRK